MKATETCITCKATFSIPREGYDGECYECQKLLRNAEWLGVMSLAETGFRVATAGRYGVNAREAATAYAETHSDVARQWLRPETSGFRLTSGKNGFSLYQDNILRVRFLRREQPRLTELVSGIYYRRVTIAPWVEAQAIAVTVRRACEFCGDPVYGVQSARCNECRQLLAEAYDKKVYQTLLGALAKAGTGNSRGKECRFHAIQSDPTLMVRLGYHLLEMDVFLRATSLMPYVFTRRGEIWFELAVEEIPGAAYALGV